MRPVENPGIPLFCQNKACGFSDESWKFKAHGGDDVIYHCPKCNSVAGLISVMQPTLPGIEKEKEEVKPTPIQIMWIVADLDKHTVRVVEEQAVNQIKDFDILLPMLREEEINKLPERQLNDFQVNLERLLTCLDEGVLPLNEHVTQWIEAIGVLDEEPEQKMRDPEFVEQDGYTQFSQEMIFQHGFAQGVAFVLGKRYEKFTFDDILNALDMYERFHAQNEYPEVPTTAAAGVETGPVPPKIVDDVPPPAPKVDPATIKSRVALLQKIRAKKGK